MRTRTLENEYLDTCIWLSEWAYWSNDHQNLGYPRMSFKRMAAEGLGINTRGSGYRAIPQTDRIAIIEKIMRELKKHKPIQFETLRHYFKNDKTSLEDVIQLAGLKNRHQARESLTKGIAWVDGFLCCLLR